MSNQESSLRGPAVMTVYSSWEDIRTGLQPGEVIHIGKHELPHPRKQGFDLATMSLRGWTTRRVFQDGRRRNSLRVYDYGTYFKATVVKNNPDAGMTAAVEHAMTDAPVKTALAASVGYGVYQTLRG